MNKPPIKADVRFLAELPVEIRNRLKAQTLFRPDYVEYLEGGTTYQVVCRICETPIVGWVDDEVAETTKVGSTTKVVIRQKLQQLHSWAQAHFITLSGARYDPVMCRNCVDKVTIDNVDDLYATDMFTMIVGAAARGTLDDRAKQTIWMLSQMRMKN